MSVPLQTLPQKPQLFRSFCRSLQPVIGQQVVPPPHAGPPLQLHTLPTQVLLSVHGGLQPVLTQLPIMQA